LGVDGHEEVGLHYKPDAGSVVDLDWPLVEVVEILLLVLEVDPTIAANHQVFQKQFLADDHQAEGLEAEAVLQVEKFDDVVEEVVEAGS
jgi:hypothetical protein